MMEFTIRALLPFDATKILTSRNNQANHNNHEAIEQAEKGANIPIKLLRKSRPETFRDTIQFMSILRPNDWQKLDGGDVKAPSIS